VNRRVWLRRLGAAGGIAICLIPMLLVYALTPGTSWYDFVLLMTGSHRTDGPLVVHLGSHVTGDLGLVLAVVPIAVTIWLLAPLAEYRRRDALMTLIPVWNHYIAAKICARVVDASNSDTGRLTEGVLLPSSNH
jgi:hypothetical protein